MRTVRRLLLVVLGLALLGGPVSAQADAATATAAQRGRCAVATKKIKRAKTIRAKAAARRAARRACRSVITPPKRVPPTQTVADAAPTEAAAPQSPIRPTVSLSALEKGVVDCANRERATAGLRALTVDAALTRASRAHAADMADRSYFAHNSLDGRTPWDRIAAALDGQDPFVGMGENIAMGYRDAESACVGWMNSPGHRANILDPDFTAIGAGWVDGYAVQDFGTYA